MTKLNEHKNKDIKFIDNKVKAVEASSFAESKTDKQDCLSKIDNPYKNKQAKDRMKEEWPDFVHHEVE